MQVSYNPYLSSSRYGQRPVAIHFGSKAESPKTSEKTKHISFWRLLGCVLLPAAVIIPAASIKTYYDFKPDQCASPVADTSSSNKIPDNLNILATSENTKVSYFSAYTGALLEKIKDKKVPSLEEAHSQLSQQGIDAQWPGSIFECKQQYPVGLNKRLNIWNKNDKDKHRYVLYISQKPRDEEEAGWYEKDKKNILEIVKKFGVPKENILIRENLTSYEEFQQATNDFYDMLDGREEMVPCVPADICRQYKHLDKIEALIYYHGHGGENRKFEISKDHDNFDLGFDFATRLGKPVRPVPTLAIVDSCYSGSWLKIPA